MAVEQIPGSQNGTVPIEPSALHSPKKKSSRRPFAILGAVVAVVALAIGVYLWATAGVESTDDAQVSADLVPVGTRVTGQVLRVAIQENQTVKKGDLLAEIDDQDYMAKVKQAEADLASAQAQAAAADAQVEVLRATSNGSLSTAKAAFSGSSAGVASADAQFALAQAQVVRAETEVRKAETDLRRAKEL